MEIYTFMVWKTPYAIKMSRVWTTNLKEIGKGY